MRKEIRLRFGWLAGLGLILGLILGLSAQAYAQEDFSQQARHIFELTNQDREAHGLQPLRWDTSLTQAAQTHAERMAAEGYLSHDYPGEATLMQRTAEAGAHFQAVAENIATGYSEGAIESEWMHSPSHRRNILDPQMNALGVGVVERRGTLYAVEDFDDASEALSSLQVERKVGALLRGEGIDPSVSRGAAELACSSNSGYPKGETGRLVIRFDTGDLSRLPGQVVGQIHSGNYRRASVAACPGGGRQNSFTTFRVAIVLY
jgi:Cysteine-rich secretory protein family